MLTDIRTLPVNSPIARALGAQKLDPETSKNFSLGLTAQLTSYTPGTPKLSLMYCSSASLPIR